MPAAVPWPVAAPLMGRKRRARRGLGLAAPAQIHEQAEADGSWEWGRRWPLPAKDTASSPISVIVATFEEYALSGNARFEHIVTIVTDIH
jgi:hypothetical protein